VIELPTPLGDIDLHNFAEFQELVFTAEGGLQLVWREWEERPGQFRLGARVIRRAELVFREVSLLSLTSRDPDMPRDEDRTLEELTVEQLNRSDCRLRFVFAGGRELDVTAGSLKLVAEDGDDRS
jgi:hypothetical protein